MVKAIDSLVVEAAGPLNENLWFLPLARRIRGRFDPTKIPDVSGVLRKRFPAGIPGQRLAVNVATRTACLLEPLHVPEFKAVAAECKKVGALPPEREEFANIDLDGVDEVVSALKTAKADRDTLRATLEDCRRFTIPAHPEFEARRLADAAWDSWEEATSQADPAALRGWLLRTIKQIRVDFIPDDRAGESVRAKWVFFGGVVELADRSRVSYVFGGEYQDPNVPPITDVELLSGDCEAFSPLEGQDSAGFT